MALTPFSDYSRNALGPAVGSVAITPNNSTDLARRIRAITINGSGTLSWIDYDGVTHATGMLPVGTYPLFAARIRATGTTATDITGWI